MPQLKPTDGVAAADWVVAADTPWHQLVAFGPPGFPAYARLRFIPDPQRPGQQEADVELPDDHPHDLLQAQRALRLLAPFTGTADDCFVAIWEGYSDVTLPAGSLRTSAMVLPHRRYALFRGPLAAVDRFADDFGSGQPVMPPAFVWPADHAWCFARDVDPHWAGIGAETDAVDALLADQVLDLVRAQPDQPQPLYY